MPVPLIAASSEIGPAPVVHQLAQERAIRPLFYNHYLIGTLPDNVYVRARAAGYFLPPTAVLTTLAAAWVYTGGVPPKQISVLLQPGSSPVTDPWDIRAIRTAVSSAEMHHINGAAIATLERTVGDLARWEEPGIARAAITRLAAAGADLLAARRLLPEGQRQSLQAVDLIPEHHRVRTRGARLRVQR